MDKEQLQSLCGDSSRPTVAKPFSFKLDGRWFNAATNGHAIAAIETTEPDYVREHSPPAKDLFLKRKSATHTLDVGPLLDWLKDCEMWEFCKACRGVGAHKCDCFYCEMVDDDTCPECEGERGSWAQLPARFEHIQFNRVLLARYLAPFGDSGIAKMWLGKGELDPFEIRGDGWRVLTMPMRPREGDNEAQVPTSLIQVAS